MPYIEPNSTVIIFSSVPFDATYENTVYFDSPEDQISYFINTPQKITLNNYSYQRKDKGVIKVELPIARVYKASYMMYRNTEFENKWFFAFITKVEYVNNVTTAIYYEIDLLQTWHFDYTFNQCMIERQHTTTDSIGGNIVPENLELGEYVTQAAYYKSFTPVIVLASSLAPKAEWDDTGIVYPGRTSNGSYFSGARYQLFNPNDPNDVDRLNNLLKAYVDANALETIIGIFMGNREFFTSAVPIVETFDVRTRQNGVGDLGYFIDDYPVRNKKLMTDPFNFLQVSNLQGEHIELCYEYFSDPTNIQLQMWGNASMRPGILLYPLNYKNMLADYDNTITLQAYPLCSYNYDTFKAWLAQNAGVLTMGAIAGLLQLGSGLNFTGNVPVSDWQGNSYTMPGKLKYDGDVSNLGVAGALGVMGKIWDHARKPVSQNGSGNGDLMYQAGLNMFAITHRCITAQMARKIDSFFDMYGYAINDPGVPNRNARPCYTYTKTRGCSIKGDLPADDARAIETIYDKGVRWWKPSATFGVFDPNVNNNTV